jgi:two-component system NtrC family sensor kinase
MARILVVDDQPEPAELIRTVLEEAGHSVEAVHGGRAALERLAQHTYDLIVCDLHMPDRDGPAVYRALARRPPPRPPVVLVTGYADAGPYAAFLRAAQVPVLAKPIGIDELRERVRRLLENR